MELDGYIRIGCTVLRATTVWTLRAGRWRDECAGRAWRLTVAASLYLHYFVFVFFPLQRYSQKMILVARHAHLSVRC